LIAFFFLTAAEKVDAGEEGVLACNFVFLQSSGRENLVLFVMEERERERGRELLEL